jgi:sugar lactone lactonase YvrE
VAASLVGVLSGDAVTLGTSGAVGTFASKNAAQNITVSVAGLTIGGAQASDYTLTQPATTANITAEAITVTATSNDKIYDGTTSAAAVPAITAGSLAASDTAAFTETYDNKNVGTGKTLTAAGSVNDGNGGNNYTVSFAADTAGQITPLAIIISAVAATKTYDGTMPSAATPAIVGVVTTMAGSAGQVGSSDGIGSAARFDYPEGVAVDSAGNVYVADQSNDEIRKITPSGVVSTLAGSAGQPGSSDGTGSAARFYEPTGVALDSAGNVYVADKYNDEIRKITPSGVVSTLAGSAGQIGSSNGAGGAARFDDPEGVAVDSAGNVYVADASNDEIRKVTPSGVVTTLAGSAGQSGSSDGTGSAARFYHPTGVAVDSAGNVYVADYYNQEIREVTPSGVVTTLAGSAGQVGSSDGIGSAATFDYPWGVAVDSEGNVYVADAANNEIRKITPSGAVTTLAGSAGQTGSSDGTGSAARFDQPTGVAVDSAGNVYVADRRQ